MSAGAAGRGIGSRMQLPRGPLSHVVRSVDCVSTIGGNGQGEIFQRHVFGGCSNSRGHQTCRVLSPVLPVNEWSEPPLSTFRPMTRAALTSALGIPIAL